MKRDSKNLVTLALAFFFVSALLCAGMAAPGRALASASGCSQTPGTKAMADCQHPGYFCGLDRSFISEGVLSSARFNDSLKSTLGVAACQLCFDSAPDGDAFPGNNYTNIRPAGPYNFPVHLYNSVLNL